MLILKILINNLVDKIPAVI